ncbi:MAG TPA: hypothetical protein GXX29_11675 [Firmicutes bacterium]|nr:hypothetical protein [Bacillota bacterium]
MSKNKNIVKKVLYIGWVGFNNRGDDACLEFFRQHLNAALAARDYRADIKAVYPSPSYQTNITSLKPDLFVLGGGSVLGLPYISAMAAAQQADIPTITWGSGIDGLSDEVMNSLKSKTPLDISTVYTDEHMLTSMIIRECPHVFVRGPYTRSFLHEITGGLTSATICGDPGLLMAADEIAGIPAPAALDTPPSSNSPANKDRRKLDLYEYVNAHSSGFIAVNWGTVLNKMYGRNEKGVAHQLAEALKNISAVGLGHYPLLLYAMWPRDLPALETLARLLGSPSHVQLLPWVPSLEEIALILSRSVLSINLKLHGSIFSAALGCPFICLAYRSKAFDFCASVECEDVIVRTDDPHLGEAVWERARKITNNMDRYRSRLITKRNLLKKELAGVIDTCCNLLIGD